MAKYTYDTERNKWFTTQNGFTTLIEPTEYFKNGKAKPPKKKISAIQKGKQSENRTHKYLENLGCVVHTIKSVRSQWSKFIINADIFGLFDHVAFLDRKNVEYSTNSLFVNIHVNRINPKFTIIRDELHLLQLFYGETFYIQTKTNSVNRETRELIAKIPIKQHKLIFVWKDRVEEPEIILC